MWKVGEDPQHDVVRTHDQPRMIGDGNHINYPFAGNEAKGKVARCLDIYWKDE